jgi:hypothetical protein
MQAAWRALRKLNPPLADAAAAADLLTVTKLIACASCGQPFAPSRSIACDAEGALDGFRETSTIRWRGLGSALLPKPDSCHDLTFSPVLVVQVPALVGAVWLLLLVRVVADSSHVGTGSDTRRGRRSSRREAPSESGATPAPPPAQGSAWQQLSATGG